jgi:hypothetical protein
MAKKVARAAKNVADRFFNNARKITDKMTGFDAVWSNGNAQFGAIKAGKLGYRASVTFGQRSCNGTTGDLRAMVQGLTGQPLPEGSPGDLLCNAIDEKNITS